MDKKDFYYLGKIVKTSGFKGSLVFFFDVDEIEYYRNLEAVFIEIGSELIPFAIRSLNIKSGKTAYVTLEEVNNEEQAIALVNQNAYLPVSFLPELSGNKFYFHEVIGFIVIDEKHGLIGEIEKVYDHGPQALLSVKGDKNEILIPVADEIIKKVNRHQRQVIILLPEGLLDIYL
ncbi:MAG: ribosome maturation factor RimM [Bacteroidales bacterium]|nr:ribosome maturation factor RimM [Bacteroidales bacterium]MCF8402783.1 ribosome maturation factor RimM [Bacteroidales bacterium]